ncbi:MAG: hypothetical protein U1B80_07490, partial [Anaerolineaceae bacterium]|nr:hypothetical protein [Anaerolineaceae bacterium]
RLNLFDPVIDILSAEEFSEDESADIEIEESFAFPKAELAGSVEIMCRFMDWDNVYKLSVERSKWTLSAVVDGDERRLGSGTTLDGFQGGDWGRFNLRCFGSQISAWQNGKLLIRAIDSDLETGSWAVSLYADEELAEAEVAMFAHRVYRRSQERFGMLEDRVESGDMMVSLERSWRAEGGGYSLRLMVENRGAEAIPLKAENILLESVDGITFMAEEQPPANRSGTPLPLPLNLQPGDLSGDVYFRGFGASEISRGIDLVLDLESLGFGVIRFSLPLK